MIFLQMVICEGLVSYNFTNTQDAGQAINGMNTKFVLGLYMYLFCSTSRPLIGFISLPDHKCLKNYCHSLGVGVVVVCRQKL